MSGAMTNEAAYLYERTICFAWKWNENGLVADRNSQTIGERVLNATEKYRHLTDGMSIFEETGLVTRYNVHGCVFSTRLTDALAVSVQSRSDCSCCLCTPTIHHSSIVPLTCSLPQFQTMQDNCKSCSPGRCIITLIVPEQMCGSEYSPSFLSVRTCFKSFETSDMTDRLSQYLPMLCLLRSSAHIYHHTLE